MNLFTTNSLCKSLVISVPAHVNVSARLGKMAEREKRYSEKEKNAIFVSTEKKPLPRNTDNREV